MEEERNELPMGLSMSLGMHQETMNHFGRMTEEQKQQVVRKSREVRSKSEMQQLVHDIGEGKFQG